MGRKHLPHRRIHVLLQLLRLELDDLIELLHLVCKLGHTRIHMINSIRQLLLRAKDLLYINPELLELHSISLITQHLIEPSNKFAIPALRTHKLHQPILELANRRHRLLIQFLQLIILSILLEVRPQGHTLLAIHFLIHV
jgi:hypothetical protein